MWCKPFAISLLESRAVSAKKRGFAQLIRRKFRRPTRNREEPQASRRFRCCTRRRQCWLHCVHAPGSGASQAINWWVEHAQSVGSPQIQMTWGCKPKGSTQGSTDSSTLKRPCDSREQYQIQTKEIEKPPNATKQQKARAVYGLPCISTTERSLVQFSSVSSR